MEEYCAGICTTHAYYNCAWGTTEAHGLGSWNRVCISLLILEMGYRERRKNEHDGGYFFSSSLGEEYECDE